MQKPSIKKTGGVIVIDHPYAKNFKLDIDKIISINRFNQVGLNNFVTIDVLVSGLFSKQPKVDRIALPFDTYQETCDFHREIFDVLNDKI
jgi:hypothetical protein